MNLDPLLSIAIEAAKTAGQMIARSRPQNVRRKEGGESLASQVLSEVDEQSQKIILEILEPTFSAIGCLTEESEDDRSRFEKEFFWCIDPLDGTLPFIDAIPGYAVSIALVARDGTPHIGAVYDPIEQACYHAVRGGGLYKNSKPWKMKAPDTTLRLITDRSFEAHPRFFQTLDTLEQIAADLGFSGGVQTRMTGGAAMNAIWVLENAPACYFKFPKVGKGGGSLWDFAATACLFAEAGGAASDFFGDPLDLNRADSTFMNHRGILFASDSELASQIRARFEA